MLCKDVRKEPTLSSTLNSNDEFQADINSCCFWQRLQIVFVDLILFYPFAPNYQNQLLATYIKAMENHEKIKP